MLHTWNDAAQTIVKKKNGSIETSQYWSAKTINHWNGKKEDEKLAEAI